jgi:hypothetical protein
VSALLRQRDPFPNSPHETSHCFFGTHLLTESHFKGHTEITEITERPKGQIEITERFPTSYAQPVPEALSVISVISVCPKKSVCVVEAEKTAVIMSELYPEYVWLAAGGLGEVQTEKFRPLRGHKVVLFPDTFLKYYLCIVKEKPDEASRNYGTFSQNNPFIPPEKAVLSSRLHRDTRSFTSSTSFARLCRFYKGDSRLKELL